MRNRRLKILKCTIKAKDTEALKSIMKDFIEETTDCGAITNCLYSYGKFKEIVSKLRIKRWRGKL